MLDTRQAGMGDFICHLVNLSDLNVDLASLLSYHPDYSGNLQSHQVFMHCNVDWWNQMKHTVDVSNLHSKHLAKSKYIGKEHI